MLYVFVGALINAQFICSIFGVLKVDIIQDDITFFTLTLMFHYECHACKHP